MKKRRPAQAAFAHITIGLQLAVTILLFIFGGLWLDTKFQMTPLFLVIGLVIGMAVGFYSLIKELKNISEREKENKNSSNYDEKKRVRWM